MTATLDTLISIAKRARGGGYSVMSLGEKLAAALILNRPDWIIALDYTLADALDRVGQDWVRLIPTASQHVERAAEEEEQAAYAAAEKAQAEKMAKLAGGDSDGVEFSARLVTYSNAPGYRDVGLIFDLSTQGAAPTSFRATLRVSAEDGARIVADVGHVHGFAWKRGEPLDIRPGEKPPRWVSALA